MKQLSTLEVLVDSMLTCFYDLDPADLVALRRMLYSLAVTIVHSAFDSHSGNWRWTKLKSDDAFIAAFLPLTALYIAAYLGWRHKRSLKLLGNPRTFSTIIVIDILGIHMAFPLEWIESWKVRSSIEYTVVITLMNVFLSRTFTRPYSNTFLSDDALTTRCYNYMTSFGVKRSAALKKLSAQFGRR